MRVFFCNRYFWPDHSATAQILSDLAFFLPAHCARVAVITSAASYSDAKLRFRPHEWKDDVEIWRTPTVRLGRNRMLGRLLDYAVFYIFASIFVLRRVGRGDILVIKTDPPLLSVFLVLAVRVKGAKTVLWQQDLYPEVAAAFGVAAARGILGKGLRRMRNWSMMGADKVVAIGEIMADLLQREGVPAPKIAVIPNWTDDEAIVPGKASDNALRCGWGFAPNELVVGYSGNLGRAHDLSTIMECARILDRQHQNRVKFLFVGGGFLHDELRRIVFDEGLANVELRPYQPRQILNETLGVPDIHWISLRDMFEGLIVPSKFYGVAAAGRPTIFIGSATGELARIIGAHKLGFVIPQGNSQALANLLLRLSDDRSQLNHVGIRARAYVDERGCRSARMSEWLTLLLSVDSG